jgi:shikimate kinase
MGPKHCGKSSLGRALGGAGFYDLDSLVEERSGKSPRQLYLEGPELFQAAEASALEFLLHRNASTPLILAAGGGLIDNREAMEMLDAALPPPLTVYIEVSAATAWERIAADRSQGLPPFLQTADPQESHRLLHERRAAAYRQAADIILSGEGKTPHALAEEALWATEVRAALSGGWN